MMRFADIGRMALRNLTGSLTKSLLTILGLAIGVGATIAIGSLGTAAVGEVQREMGRFGIDRLWVSSTANNPYPLSREDALALERSLGFEACPMRYGLDEAQAGTRSALVSLVATDQDYRKIEAITMDAGRFLLKTDDEQALRVAVIEDSLAKQLFDGRSPLGEQIRIGQSRFSVVGVIRTAYSSFAASDNARAKVYLPLSTFEQLYGADALEEITLKVSGDIPQSVRLVKNCLLTAHGLTGGYSISSLYDQILSANRISRIFVLVLGCIGLICMVTGGIGVMNVLLAGVRERRREIGIRKAIGARDRDIAAQFICEALFYGALGALVGLGMGAAFTYLGGEVIGIGVTLVGNIVALAIVFSCGLGLICGVYPAMRASQVPPVAAMRSIS